MILCIDTSTEFSGIAIVADAKCHFQKLNIQHASESILETIDSLIQTASIELSDLKGVLVIKGPGSFTGLRVGIAVANQFSHQLNIPIAGLSTQDFYQYQSDESDFFYLQSMNRDQVYMVGLGLFQSDFPPQIISISQSHHELSSLPGSRWLGSLSDDHLSYFHDIKRIKTIHSPGQMWKKAVDMIIFPKKQSYDLVEPFYGKDPTITKGKNNLFS